MACARRCCPGTSPWIRGATRSFTRPHRVRGHAPRASCDRVVPPTSPSASAPARRSSGTTTPSRLMRHGDHIRRHGFHSVSLVTRTTAAVATISTAGFGVLAATTPKPNVTQSAASAAAGTAAAAASVRVGSSHPTSSHPRTSQDVATTRPTVHHNAVSAPAARSVRVATSPSSSSWTPPPVHRQVVRTAPAVQPLTPAPQPAPVVASGGS